MGKESRTIPLTKGYEAIVDADRYDDLARHRWLALIKKRATYAVRGVNGSRPKTNRLLYMHRYIMQAESGLVVDHRNCNGLDNRVENLRVCTQSQNLANSTKKQIGSSKFKGVFWEKSKRAWQSQIGAGEMKGERRKVIKLGLFFSEEEAARAYDRKAYEIHGEFARLNFPEEFPGSLPALIAV